VQFLFSDHQLDPDRRELRRGAEIVMVEPQVFDLLLYLVQNRERVVSRDDLIASVWSGRIVSDSTLDSRINAVRKAIGDSGNEQRLIRTVARKGFRFIADVHETATTISVARERTRLPGNFRQEVRFCIARDGVRIAYAEVGSGPPLLRTGHWLTHLEYDWESPVWHPLLSALAAEYRLVRYDARGNGLSDWDAKDISLDSFVGDMEAVVAASGLDRFDLLGVSQGAAFSVAYAVRHPEKVRHLVLYGGFARGRRMRGSAEEVAKSEAFITLMRQGTESAAFRELFTSLFIPEGTSEQKQWFNDLLRVTTSPQNAARLRSLSDATDVTDLLPRVRTPTLVLHCRDDAVQPLDEGRRLAAGIPGARFVVLEGRNHVLLAGDPGWPRFFDEIRVFLRE
jgi:pimeloyl-ACP methyl ester carboxylesterase/DNA-binding winged helix-turn-helix (wHTH) protein